MFLSSVFNLSTPPANSPVNPNRYTCPDPSPQPLTCNRVPDTTVSTVNVWSIWNSAGSLRLHFMLPYLLPIASLTCNKVPDTTIPTPGTENVSSIWNSVGSLRLYFTLPYPLPTAPLSDPLTCNRSQTQPSPHLALKIYRLMKLCGLTEITFHSALPAPHSPSLSPSHL